MPPISLSNKDSRLFLGDFDSFMIIQNDFDDRSFRNVSEICVADA